MTITSTAFERSPDGGKGLARDTRVRWALEEVGQPYEARLVSFRAMKEPAHLALHPFGQIRPMRKAISRCSRQGRSNTVEPPILELGTARLLECGKPPGPTSSDAADCVAFDLQVSPEERERFCRNVSRPGDNRSRHGAILSVAYNDFPPSVATILRKLLALSRKGSA